HRSTSGMYSGTLRLRAFPCLLAHVELMFMFQFELMLVSCASSCSSDDGRTTIGVVGAPKRLMMLSIHAAVVLLNQPRCWPQSAQWSAPACGPLPSPMMARFRQHGFC